jgi:hypothetical protein
VPGVSKAADKLKNRTFDPAQLEAMTEPFTVRVERLKGTTRSPIPLWKVGADWDKEEIQTLETNLVTNWAGGGLYAVTVVDSSVPDPKRLDWHPFYDPNAYPERTPPPLESATVGAVTPSSPPPPSVLASTGSAPNRFTVPAPSYPFTPRMMPNMSQQPPFQNPYFGQQFPQFQYQAPAPAAQPIPVGAAQQAAALAEMERRQAQEELRAMREQLAKQREDMLAEKHRAELDRARIDQQAQIDARFAKLEQLLVASAQQQAARPIGPDPALEAMKEQLRAAEARAEQDRRDRESERRERDLKDSMAQQAENTRREMESLKLLMSQNVNKGPDPVLMMFQEMNRTQIEAMKEQSRSQQLSAERASANALAPRDIIALMKESNAGPAEMTKGVVSVYNDMFNVQRQLIETAAQLNAPPGDSVPSLIREGVERFSQLADRYQSSKSKEAVATVHAQAQVEQAKIQAAMLAQNPHLAMAAQREQQGATSLPEAPPAPVSIATPPIVTGPAGTGPKRLGRTDAEWFGPILPRVLQLREAVTTYLSALNTTPPTLDKHGNPPGLSAIETAGMIGQATSMAVQNNIAVPALIDLLVQNRIADFLDVTLPDAPQAYRDDVYAAMEAMVGGDAGEEDEDEDDEGGEDEGEEAAPVVTVPPAKATVKNGRRAST